MRATEVDDSRAHILSGYRESIDLPVDLAIPRSGNRRYGEGLASDGPARDQGQKKCRWQPHFEPLELAFQPCSDQGVRIALRLALRIFKRAAGPGGHAYWPIICACRTEGLLRVGNLVDGGQATAGIF